MPKNYYDILGVPRSASKDEIKKAFHKLAHKYHPDKKGGDEDKFKEVSEAYKVLSDDKRRSEYDAYGRVFSDGNGMGANGFGGFDFSQFAEGAGDFNFDLGDIFGDFFGGRRGRGRRGRDISIDLELSFADSVFGTERKVLITKVGECRDCDGKGAKPGSGTEKCPVCNGQGKIHETRQSIFGTFSTVATCSHCRGIGEVPKEKCPKCAGAGVEKRQEEISIKVPAGTEDGEMIRLSGAGEAISGGTTGDLYVKIHVKPHTIFKKEGHNLVRNLNVKLSDAILGAEYTVSTLEGNIKLKIPAGASFGELLRVRGKGVPTGGRSRGDLLVRINIQLPQKLSKNAKNLMEELRKEGI